MKAFSLFAIQSYRFDSRTLAKAKKSSHRLRIKNLASQFSGWQGLRLALSLY
jgi:hypothetical protein